MANKSTEKRTDIGKVLTISFSNLPSPQNYLYNCQEGLVRLGVQAYTIGSSNIRDARRTLSERNRLVRVSKSPKPSLSSVIGALGALNTILATVRETSPDIVHFTSKHSWNVPVALAIKASCRSVIVHTFHDPLGHDGDRVQRGVVHYHKVISSLLDGIVVHSEKSERDTADVLRPKSPVYRAPLGSTKWAEFRGPGEPTRKLLIFGRLNRYKGVELIPGIAHAIHDIDPELTVVVAGAPAAEVSNELIDEIAQCENVVLRAEEIPEDELDGYFYDCDAVLLTHTSITQSGVILDALSHGKPVVSFDIAGIGEYLPPGSPQASPFDPQDFARIAVEMISDISALESGSRAAWEFGERHFSEDRMAAALLDVYEAVIKAANRSTGSGRID